MPFPSQMAPKMERGMCTASGMSRLLKGLENRRHEGEGAGGGKCLRLPTFPVPGPLVSVTCPSVPSCQVSSISPKSPWLPLRFQPWWSEDLALSPLLGGGRLPKSPSHDLSHFYRGCCSTGVCSWHLQATSNEYTRFISQQTLNNDNDLLPWAKNLVSTPEGMSACSYTPF